MSALRVIITADTPGWALTAGLEMSGNATSVIACDAEVAIESTLEESQTPDGRPGVSILVFAFNKKALAKAAVNRIGQCVLTSPTTACYNGIPISANTKKASIGGQLRYFGDGFQISKKLGARRFWRIPVMDGEFICEDQFGVVTGVGGGNLLICGSSRKDALQAAERAAAAINALLGVIMPFPGGIVRSGSKVGSRYKALKASTNDKWCPTLRSQTATSLPDNAQAVYEIVIDGIDFQHVQDAMRAGLHAATASPGVVLVSAGNYGGQLGPHHFALSELLEKQTVTIK